MNSFHQQNIYLSEIFQSRISSICPADQYNVLVVIKSATAATRCGTIWLPLSAVQGAPEVPLRTVRFGPGPPLRSSEWQHGTGSSSSVRGSSGDFLRWTCPQVGQGVEKQGSFGVLQCLWSTLSTKSSEVGRAMLGQSHSGRRGSQEGHHGQREAPIPP